MNLTNRNVNNQGYIKIIFIVIEAILYLTFTILDTFILNKDMWNLSNRLKYVSIFICFIYLILIYNKNRKRNTNKNKGRRKANTSFDIRRNLLLIFIFLGLLGADYYLLFTTDVTMGIKFFVYVQIIYSDYISSFRKIIYKHRKIGFIHIVLGVFLLLYTINSLHMVMDEMILVLGFYILLFLSNLIKLFIRYRTKVNVQLVEVLFTLGFILYFLCDLCVALYNINDFIPYPMIHDRWKKILQLGMWSFYLPGKVLICLSLNPNTFDESDKYE